MRSLIAATLSGLETACIALALSCGCIMALTACASTVTEYAPDGVTPARLIKVQWPQSYEGLGSRIEPGRGTVDAATTVTIMALKIGGEAVANRIIDKAAESANRQSQPVK